VSFELLQQIISADYPEKGSRPGIYHQSWWRTKDLLHALHEAGYAKIEEWADCPHLTARVDWQVVLRARTA
jgi:hypothetical protein